MKFISNYISGLRFANVKLLINFLAALCSLIVFSKDFIVSSNVRQCLLDFPDALFLLLLTPLFDSILYTCWPAVNVLFIDFQTLNTVKLNLSKNRIHVHLKQDHRIKVQFQFANGSRNVAIPLLICLSSDR